MQRQHLPTKKHMWIQQILQAFVRQVELFGIQMSAVTPPVQT